MVHPNTHSLARERNHKTYELLETSEDVQLPKHINCYNYLVYLLVEVPFECICI